ncbi:ACP S-malonyltransferase [Agrobacterium vitis]|uniref:[acyl-carrier-protein] S-malonyltransferase n=1 Tax=Agrobacterium vitis TaxID=373 RepID=A0A7K1RFY7_AGRVI|nr:ACP S-malonyltransferase [Agrobacterium vitis]MVA56839.1 ACP S-malonyltransferase [Agrobacterium vitis]
MKVVIFPGQGSQAQGMGKELFDHFKELTESASDVLGYSIRELCLEDPRGELNNTGFTQPALYVVNALSYYKHLEGKACAPDYLAGHSLGEYNALLAAGCFDFITGLKLVKRRGELMAQVSNGAMAAILNASKEDIERILRENGLTNVDLANYNTPSQIVISGLSAEVAKAEPLFTQGPMRYYPLNTSGAFHSRFMRPVKEEFSSFLKTFSFAAPKIPVISNVSARPYDGAGIAEGLAGQIASTVRWSESVQYLLVLAAKRGDSAMFEEMGHGNVLSRLVHTVKQQTSPSDLSAIAAATEATRPPTVTTAAHVTDTEGGSAKLVSAAEKVEAWNRRYGIGTKVRSKVVNYPALETRTQAILLFGHRAAVYMKGYNGYFDLDELAVL